MRDGDERLIGAVVVQVRANRDGDYRFTVELPGVIAYSMQATREELTDAVGLVEKRVGECLRGIVAGIGD